MNVITYTPDLFFTIKVENETEEYFGDATAHYSPADQKFKLILEVQFIIMIILAIIRSYNFMYILFCRNKIIGVGEHKMEVICWNGTGQRTSQHTRTHFFFLSFVYFQKKKDKTLARRQFDS